MCLVILHSLFKLMAYGLRVNRNAGLAYHPMPPLLLPLPLALLLLMQLLLCFP